MVYWVAAIVGFLLMLLGDSMGSHGGRSLPLGVLWFVIGFIFVLLNFMTSLGIWTVGSTPMG
jgi:hypothetical protein